MPAPSANVHQKVNFEVTKNQSSLGPQLSALAQQSGRMTLRLSKHLDGTTGHVLIETIFCEDNQEVVKTTQSQSQSPSKTSSPSLPARASDHLGSLQDNHAGLSAPQAYLLAQITCLTDPVSHSSDSGWPLIPSDQPNILILFSQALWLASRHSDQPLAFCLALLPLS